MYTHFYVRAREPCTCLCMQECLCVSVCSLGLFSVVSLIMRKLFNVCLPVERGRECETVIAERVRGKSKGGSQTDTPAHAV